MTDRTHLWSLRDDLHVEAEPDHESIRLRGRWGEMIIRRPSSDIREALRRMRFGPVSLENIIDGRPDDRASALTHLHQVLDHLQPLVVRTLALETGEPLLSVVPITPGSRFHPLPLAPDASVRLSSFAQLRTNGREYLVESPLALHRVLLHRAEAIHLIGVLGRPVTVADATTMAHGRERILADALAYLVAAGMVITARPSSAGQAAFAEIVDPALAGWSAVDLMFHTRSTLGRHDHDFGGTYPTGAQRCPEPVVKPRRAGPAIPLHRPRWEDLCSADPPLTVAIEGRRSVREQEVTPVSASELGDLLYRTARVRSVMAPPGNVDSEPILSDRPYPGAGARHELELYVTISDCADIIAGTYHYDPLGHQLEPIDTDPAATHEMLQCAQVATGMEVPPSVLITMTARFRRMSWKYEGLPYALVLMDVGVLMQTLYLTCTAMRLGGCAIGAVRTDVAARAFGTDWSAEPSVGQFMVNRESGSAQRRSGQWRLVNDGDWGGRARTLLGEKAARPRGSGKI
jgi:SagB-type dehydrogenase family enzyme